MDTECCRPGVAENCIPKFVCASCRGDGAPVSELTVKSMLCAVALQRYKVSAFRFCPTASCDVVYFDAEGQTFTTGDLRVSVWQKQRIGSRTICYCFGETDEDLRGEFAATGQSNAEARVRAHIEAQRCACEVRNPKGACCLGDIIETAKQVSVG